MRCVDVNVLVNAHRPEAPDHDRYRAWLDDARTSDEALGVSDLVPDAYLAAMAIERGATWYSADRGFARFSRLDWRRPLD